MFFSSQAFVLIHVAISLAAIAAGLVAVADLAAGRLRAGWTAAFLWLTLATSLTGFLFPISVFTPALAFGVLSTVLLALAFAALYRFHLAGAWRVVYVVTAIAALWLNVFVLIVQAFQKVGPLHALAPTGAEPPFAAAQVAALAILVWAGWRSLKRFRPATTRPV
ncbi:hypothetical protein [Methylobrevis albus]|uniref:Uncharacterized protein n=1 Tax=Methylobrevis albus TaxID=2793297 RepID=A0A931I0D6_9HYPH|nr:hypothetical protein [Methylobrevis albus]MBH0237432.1 hypothetical protein [Methylobrevis albus]